MRELTSEEKLVTVMAYTQNMLARGEFIGREGLRVSIWLRTQGVPNYVHLFDAHTIVFGGGAPKTTAYPELYVPTNQVIAFHLAPPIADPLDYDASETNRAMIPVNAMIGSFVVKAKIRISAATDLSTSLDVMHTAWISLYEAEITNPNLPQFNMQVPMLLVNSNTTGFGV